MPQEADVYLDYEGKVLAWYRCTVRVEMHRGGEPLGQYPFLRGKIYPYVGKKYNDFLIINEWGWRHPMDLRFMKLKFERVPGPNEESSDGSQ